MLRAALALASASALLSGCVAAVAVPVVAGGLIAKNQLGKKSRKRAEQARAPATQPLRTPQGRVLLAEIEGRTAVPVNGSLPPPSGAVDAPAAAVPAGSAVVTNLTALPPPDGVVPAGARPAGSTIAPAGENAAFSIQAYQSLWSYVGGKLAQQRAGEAIKSVVPEAGASFESLEFAPCGQRPLAVMIDIDQSTTPGVAFTRGDPDARWRRWKGDGSDAVAAVPGAADTIAAMRRDQVAVLFTSTRSPESAPAVSAVLGELGLGPAEAGKSLYLSGGTKIGGEDVRRAFSAHYCVIAIAGDELADFTNLFDAVGADDMIRRNAASETMVAPLWGAGWFLLPNPIYSTAAPGAESLTGVN